MSNRPVVTTYEEGPLTTLTINRPDRANALNLEAIEILTEHFGHTGSARVVVLTGADRRAFCAGADLSGSLPEATADGFTRLLTAMDNCPVPIIARVNGAAAGGGVGLLCAADIAIAADTASVSTPEARVGLFPFMILPYLLRVASPRQVADMAYVGTRLSAIEAIQAGFFTRACPSAELDEQVSITARSIATMGPQAIQAGRRAFLKHISNADTPDLAMAQAFRSLSNGAEAAEGLAARREGRQPDWSYS